MVEWGKTGPGPATREFTTSESAKEANKWVFLLRVRNEDDDKPHPVKRKSGNLQKERRISRFILVQIWKHIRFIFFPNKLIRVGLHLHAKLAGMCVVLNSEH